MKHWERNPSPWPLKAHFMGLLTVFAQLIATGALSANTVPASQNETFPAQAQQVDALRVKIGKRPADAKLRIELGKLFEKKQDHVGVIETLKPLSDTLPRQGLLMLARAYGKSGDTMSEARTLELCLAKSPKDYYVQTALGEAYSRAKRREEAIASFMQARDFNPRYLPAFDGLLRETLAANDTYEARTLLNDMIKRFGEKAEYLNHLCRLYAHDAYLEKAIEICGKAIQKDPKTSENYVYLGVSLKEKEEEEKAFAILSEAAAKFPKSEMVQSAAGEIEASRKNHMAAFKLFHRALESDPKSTRALIGYANSAFELQKNEEALGAFVRACAIDRKLGKEMRIALGKLKARKDSSWERRFEDGLAHCN